MLSGGGDGVDLMLSIISPQSSHSTEQNDNVGEITSSIFRGATEKEVLSL
jgi:hypothetical protein